MCKMLHPDVVVNVWPEDVSLEVGVVARAVAALLCALLGGDVLRAAGVQFNRHLVVRFMFRDMCRDNFSSKEEV